MTDQIPSKKKPATAPAKPAPIDAQAQSIDHMLAKAFSARTSHEPATDGSDAAPAIEMQRCGLIAIVGSCSKCERRYQTKSGLQKHKTVCKVVDVTQPIITPELGNIDLQTKIDNLERVIGKLTSLVENKLTTQT